jgi:hypothetical protein
MPVFSNSNNIIIQRIIITIVLLLNPPISADAIAGGCGDSTKPVETFGLG